MFLNPEHFYTWLVIGPLAGGTCDWVFRQAGHRSLVGCEGAGRFWQGWGLDEEDDEWWLLQRHGVSHHSDLTMLLHCVFDVADVTALVSILEV